LKIVSFDILCPESLGKDTKFITLDQVLSIKLVQRRCPFLGFFAAMLDFTMTKYMVSLDSLMPKTLVKTPKLFLYPVSLRSYG